ncbi:MAG: Xaa-Pro dipeptidase, partial [Gammaproteobacteria bacterium]|nr:Xaa-Pro dipeptidase [Gammaproteobacteria bacterium]
AIVAGGANACTLHYTANNQPLESGQLLLVDAGAEVGHYAADITRTYPINGQFSPEQRLIYELVLRAQQAGIACVKPNAPWDSIQATVVEVLTSGMLSLGLLTGDLNTLIEERAYQLFYMHSAGHWLGLDVHDVGAYRQNGNSRLLQPGMTLTVEPGIYIPEDCDAVDKKWRGIGVRIEDDILVTSDGHENLTGALAVSPDELERLVCGS